MTLFMSAQKINDQMKDTMLLEQILQVMPSCIKCFDFPLMREQD